jgi:hypothetical protein
LKSKELFKIWLIILVIVYVAFNLFSLSFISVPTFSFLELLGMFTCFYILRYLAEAEYREKAKVYILVDIVLTSIAFLLLQTFIGFVFY